MAREAEFVFTGICKVQDAEKRLKNGHYTFRIDPTTRRCGFVELRSGLQFREVVTSSVMMEEDQLRIWADKVLLHPLAQELAPHQALTNGTMTIAETLATIEKQWGPPRKPNEREFLGVKGEALSFGSVVVSFDGTHYRFKQKDLSFVAACELAAYIRSDRRWDSDDDVSSAAVLVVRPVEAWNGDTLRDGQPAIPPRRNGAAQQEQPTKAVVGADLTLPTHYNTVVSILGDLIELIPKIQADHKDSRVDDVMRNLIEIMTDAHAALCRFRYQTGRENTLAKWRKALEEQMADRQRAVERELTALHDRHLAKLRTEFDRLEDQRQALADAQKELAAERVKIEQERRELAAAQSAPRLAQPVVAAETSVATSLPEKVQALIAARNKLLDEQRNAEVMRFDSTIAELEALWLEASTALEEVQKLHQQLQAAGGVSNPASMALLTELQALVAKHGGTLPPSSSKPAISSPSVERVESSPRSLEEMKPVVVALGAKLDGVSQRLQKARDLRPVYT